VDNYENKASYIDDLLFTIDFNILDKNEMKDITKVHKFHAYSRQEIEEIANKQYEKLEGDKENKKPS